MVSGARQPGTQERTNDEYLRVLAEADLTKSQGKIARIQTGDRITAASISEITGQYVQIKGGAMQQVFYQLIEQETRTVMLANAQKEYVFTTVDPAAAPQDKSEPKRALIVIVGTMLGGMLAVLIVFVRAFLKNGGTPNNE